MTKKFFLTILRLTVFALFFLPVKQNPLILLARAEISISYTVGDSGGFHPYLQPNAWIFWRTDITNNDGITRSGTLYARFRVDDYNSVSSGDWTGAGSGLLKYNYSLSRGESETIYWHAELKNTCPTPLNSVTSTVTNNVVSASDTGYPLSRVRLTLKNRSGDSIRVYTYVNGVLQYDAGTLLSVGEDKEIEIWRGGINGSLLFSCSNPFFYSFSVTGVPGASYTCSVANDSLSNNCTSYHTAICTKTTAPPPTSGLTPILTPIITPPPSTCNICDPSENTWCAPNATACGDAKGRVLSNPCPYCASGTVHCCTPKITDCPVQINVKGVTQEPCANVEIKVRQDPRGENDEVDCGCAYPELQVRIRTAPPGSGIPPGYHVCSVGSDSCQQWKSCFWNTRNMQDAPDDRASTLPVGPYPQGRYVLEVSYGGHTPGPGNPCNDPICSASDDTTIGDCSEDIFYPPEPCSSGQTCVPINISSLNPSFNNGLLSWTTVYGKPQATTGTYSCAFRSTGDECKDAGNCSAINTRDGTNFLAAKNDDRGNTRPYKTSLTIPNLTPGREYIVSVYGWGINAKMPGDDCYPKTRPYMNLESGNLKTADYQIDSACQWQELKLKMIPPPSSSSIKVNLTSKVEKDCWDWSFQSGFDEVSICECPPPCTPDCSCAANTCEGKSCPDGCGGSCPGTKTSPAAPSGLTCSVDPVDFSSCTTPANKPNVSLRWIGDNITNETGFKIYHQLNTDPFSLLYTTPADATTYSHQVNCDRDKHTYKISATNACGDSTFSNSCWVQCVDTAPAAVNGNSLSPRGGISLQDDRVVLSWRDIGNNHTNWGLNCTGNNDRYVVYLCKEGLNCSDGNVPEAVANKVCDFADNNASTLYCPPGLNGYLDLDWESTYYWKVVTSNGAKTTSSPIASFKITYPSAWWQTKTGDVYGSEIFSPIWRDVPDNQRYFSLENPTFSGPQSGLVASLSTANNDFSGDSGVTGKGENQATQTEFSSIGHQALAANFTPLLNDYSYDQLAHLVDLAIKDDKQESYNSGVGVIKSGTINKTALVGASAGLYYYPPYGTGDMAVSLDSPFSVGANEKLIIFVEDDLNINRNITVTPGGFLAFIVKGNIKIAANVTQVKGVYFADGSLTVESNGATADSQFNGQGIFVGKNGVSLERNFRSATNATTPTEIFTFDPAYLFTAPKVFREKPYLWQEVIP